MITDEINASQLAYCQKLLETIFMKWTQTNDILRKTTPDVDGVIRINSNFKFIYHVGIFTYKFGGRDVDVNILIQYGGKRALPCINTTGIGLFLERCDDRDALWKIQYGHAALATICYSDQIEKGAKDFIRYDLLDKLEWINQALDAFLPTLQQLKTEYVVKTRDLEEKAKAWANL